MKNEPTLSTASREEIQAALNARSQGAKELECHLCSRPFRPNRKWQKFCSQKCQTDFNKMAQILEIENLQGKLAAALRRISELQEELAKSLRVPTGS